MSQTPAKITPMLEQYLGIKAENPDALLFYRMGDFYELFFDDAVTAARELQITLTSRNRDAENPVPMAGVPWHAVQGYVAQLIDKGYHVAICDQTEDPKQAKGLVGRAVSCVITPGTVLEEASLDAASHNFIGVVCQEGESGGFVWADVSTGQWWGVAMKRGNELWQWVRKIAPRELLVPEEMQLPEEGVFEGMRPRRLPAAHFEGKRAEERLLEAQGVRDVAALGLEDKEELVRACGALLCYLEQVQRGGVGNLGALRLLDLGRRLVVDEISERNLEIFVRTNGRKGKGTLRHVLDRTVTPMGGRLLEEMLRHPWRDRGAILPVQDAVAFFHADDGRRDGLREAMKGIGDIERLSARVCLNRSQPRDFVSLRDSLKALGGIRERLEEWMGREPRSAPRALTRLMDAWDPLADCADLLESSIVDAPPVQITDGGLFKEGYDAGLDRLLELAEHGDRKLQEMLEEERRECGLPRLKLGYNRVFGYYYELTRAGAEAAELPDRFLVRQSLANARRFTTEGLKGLEEGILSAAEERKSLETRLFGELREKVAGYGGRIAVMARTLAHLDYWACLAHVGRVRRWCRPEVVEDFDLDIRDGRHPVVEEILGAANFVPNSFRFDGQHRLCLLTGPNMAGKSTILRQVAIICLLAQMGSMVPASEARLGLVDRLFTRVGASDDLVKDRSTFMVEMMETARILRQATRRSLVVLDEIGRGTSTYDGLSIAWAVTEDLARRGGGGLRTLFATHYHEITALEGMIPGVFTMNIAIRDYNDRILFLHRLVPGPSDRSYGIEVARMAGVPGPVVQRAREILSALEEARAGDRKDVAKVMGTLPFIGGSGTAKEGGSPVERVVHPLERILAKVEPDVLSPMEALGLVAEWKRLYGGGEGEGVAKKSAAKAKRKSGGAKGSPKGGGKSGGKSAPKSASKSASKAVPGTAPEGVPEAGSKSEADSKSETDSRADPEGAPGAGPVAEPEAGPESVPKADPE
jgi:DNA mismatch repair protein MutS